MIHNAAPQTELPFQFCIRQIDAASAHKLLQESNIELVAFLFGRPIANQVTEADSTQFYRRN
jgi:hypothetical protein